MHPENIRLMLIFSQGMDEGLEKAKSGFLGCGEQLKGLLRRSKKPFALSLGKRDPLIPFRQFLPLFRTHTAKYFAFMARLVSPATFSYCKTLSCRTGFHIPPSLFIHIVRPRVPLTASSSEHLLADKAQSGVRGDQRAPASERRRPLPAKRSNLGSGPREATRPPSRHLGYWPRFLFPIRGDESVGPTAAA